MHFRLNYFWPADFNPIRYGSQKVAKNRGPERKNPSLSRNHVQNRKVGEKECNSQVDS